MAQFNQTGDDFMDMLAEQADGKTMITMLTCLNKATLDIIGKVCKSESALVFVNVKSAHIWNAI